MKMLAWTYNDKCYVKVNHTKLDQYAIGKSNETKDGDVDKVEFQKEHPYAMDLPSYRYGFETCKGIIKGCTNSQIMEMY